jgi:hypothetical protein
MCQDVMPSAELRRQIDRLMAHELDAERRAPGLKAAHRLDQESVIPVPVVAGSDNEFGLGLPTVAPEHVIDSEVQ